MSLLGHPYVENEKSVTELPGRCWCSLLTSSGLARALASERGLALIDELGASGELDRYHLFHTARADMLRRLGSFEAAADAYRRALALMAWNAGWRHSERWACVVNSNSAGR